MYSYYYFVTSWCFTCFVSAPDSCSIPWVVKQSAFDYNRSIQDQTRYQLRLVIKQIDTSDENFKYFGISVFMKASLSETLASCTTNFSKDASPNRLLCTFGFGAVQGGLWSWSIHVKMDQTAIINVSSHLAYTDNRNKRFVSKL